MIMKIILDKTFVKVPKFSTNNWLKFVVHKAVQLIGTNQANK